MTNNYKVKVIKSSSVSELENSINNTISDMASKGYNLKEIKQLIYDNFAGYIIILVFYKLN